MARYLVMALAGLALASGAWAQDYVWWEGEQPDRTNLNNEGFAARSYPDTRAGLSGGDWLAQGGKAPADVLFATYTVQVPADGSYEFWARKFWKHGPFRWRFDGGEWRQCGRDVALADRYELAKFVEVNWVQLGRVELAAGEHTFELQLTAEPGQDTVAAFDAFVLSAAPFSPNGKHKPGQKSGLAEQGWWAFEPDIDPLTGEAMLDLRGLNEQVAGIHGRVRREGDRMVLGDGTPVRFWAVNAVHTTVMQEPAAVDYLAARLAKMGVNLVRFHHNIFRDTAVDPFQVDQAYLDRLFYMIAALKKQGIYSQISFYYSRGYNPKASHGLGGYGKDDGDGGQGAYGLLFIEPRMQEIYRSWARTLLTTTNPYTGLTLAEDPALAILEINNEDNLLFHTFSADRIPAVYFDKLEKRFGAWLAARHGSVEKALALWPGQTCERDNADTGQVELMSAWNMTRQGALEYGPDKKRRMQEQVRFLVEVQRELFAQAGGYFKKLGYQGLVTTTGWITADDSQLDALERWTYQAGDVIDRHGYFGGGNVHKGNTYKALSAVQRPFWTPLPFVQEEGFPHTITEINWFRPNPYTADMPFLCSTYGALAGVDGYYFFCLQSSYWIPVTTNIPVLLPSIAGQFPAAALQYRRGDVTEGPVVLRQALELEGQFNLEGCTSLGINSDSFARPELAAQNMNKLQGLAPFVGRVVRRTANDPGEPLAEDLSPYVDLQAGTARAATGETFIDYTTGYATVDTPRSQGVTGFLAAAGSVELGDLAITADNEYGTIHVISLDGEPLATSRKILIQAFTQERNYGFASQPTEGDERVVTDAGTPPLNIEKLAARVVFKTPGPLRVTPLDINGYGRAEPTTVTDGQIVLPPDGLYTIVTR